MGGHQKGESRTGGSRNVPRPHRVEEDEFAELLVEAKQRRKRQRRRRPKNLTAKPLDLPPMRRIKDA